MTSSRFVDGDTISVADWTKEDSRSFEKLLQSPLVQKALRCLEETANEMASANHNSMNLQTQEGVSTAMRRQAEVLGMKRAIEILTQLATTEEEETTDEHT